MKPFKTMTIATVALFLLGEQVVTPLLHAEVDRKWLFFPQDHIHQDGPLGNRDTSKIEMSAVITAYSAGISEIRVEDILRIYRRD